MKRIKTSRGTLFSRGASIVDLLTAAHNALPGDDGDAVDVHNSTEYKEAKKELHSLDNVETPFGTLMEMFEFVEDEADAEGTFPTIEYINPFALLSYLATISREFFRFFVSLGTNLNIYLYADEVTPGNQNRPDHGRQYIAWYWSFVDYPDWFTSRRSLSLFVLAFVPHEAMRFQHSMTRMYKYFVEIFFKPDGFNFELTGVRLRNGLDSMIVKATYSVTLADEPALAKMKGSKGHSGRKPCLKCKNIMGRAGSYEDFEDDYCLHYLEQDFQRVDLHTARSFDEMATKLKNLVEGGCTNAIRNQREMNYGLIYVKDGAMFSEHVRRVTATPEDIYYDPMHCWFSSGGIGQLHVNCLLHKFIAHGIDIECVEQFVREVWLPQGCRLELVFLTNRMTDGGAFRGYAGDCIDAIFGITLFIDYVLSQTPLFAVLSDDVHCFRLLVKISDMLATRSPLIADSLEDAQNEYHKCLYALHPEACKFKIHYVKHTPNDIRKRKKVLTCFGPEAFHKFTNQVMQHSYKRSTFTATSYALHHAVASAKDPLTFREEYLSGTIRRVEALQTEMSVVAAAFPSLPSDAIPIAVHCSRVLVHARGTFKTRQIICCTVGGTVVCGRPIMFIEIKLSDHQSVYFAWMGLFTPHLDDKGRRVWVKTHDNPTLLHSSSIVRALPFVEVSPDTFLLKLPEYINC